MKSAAGSQHPFCLLCNSNIIPEKEFRGTSCHRSSSGSTSLLLPFFAFAPSCVLLLCAAQLLTGQSRGFPPVPSTRQTDVVLSTIVKAVLNVPALMYPDFQGNCASRCLSPVYKYSREIIPWAQLRQLCM